MFCLFFNIAPKEAMTDAITEILAQSPQERRRFGNAAKEFIRNNKEAKQQVAKAIQFLQH